MLNKSLLVLRTIRHLKPVQLYYQVFYRIRRQIRKPDYYANLRGYKQVKIYPSLHKAKFIPSSSSLSISEKGYEFTFINLTHTFPRRAIDWNHKDFGKLWTYNLNYFDFLFDQSIGEGDVTLLIDDYIESFDRLEDGLEPYPISLRAINWIKFIAYSGVQKEEWDKHLYMQYQVLMSYIEYHLLANHLLENALSLLFGAYYFRNESFYKKANALLRDQLKEQILEDGGHYERSPMYHQILLKAPCDLTLVVGDVTSTMACAIVAKKLNIRVAHVEAGIRSFDLSMPEEINRMVTDSITDYFFTTSKLANHNLKNLGVDSDRIFFVGNTMIDTLYKNQSRFIEPEFWDKLNLAPKEYLVITMHRPGNVDEEQKLKSLMQTVLDTSRNCPLIFPIHPRTAKVFEKLGLSNERLHLVEPLSYLEFNYLVQNSLAVLTDSGGITEETTVMGIPCLTLRDNTERPETCEIGTNELVGTDPKAIPPVMDRLFSGNWKQGNIPELWDGKTSSRIVDVLESL